MEGKREELKNGITKRTGEEGMRRVRIGMVRV